MPFAGSAISSPGSSGVESNLTDRFGRDPSNQTGQFESSPTEQGRVHRSPRSPLDDAMTLDRYDAGVCGAAGSAKGRIRISAKPPAYSPSFNDRPLPLGEFDDKNATRFPSG